MSSFTEENKTKKQDIIVNKGNEKDYMDQHYLRQTYLKFVNVKFKAGVQSKTLKQ